MSLPDHYRVLGVPRFASAGVVRRAYVALMKRHHPDTNTAGAITDEAASRISRAYWELRHPERRAVYDALLRAATTRRSRSATPQRAPVAGSPSARPSIPARRPPPTPLARPARQPRATRLVFLVSLVGLIGIGIWANGRAPLATSAFSAIPGASTVKGDATIRHPRIALIGEALSDYDRMLLDGSDAQIVDYLRECFAELTTSAPLAVFDYCVALEGAAALDPQRSGEDEFYRMAMRQARLDGVAIIPAEAARTRWEAVNDIVAALRMPNRKALNFRSDAGTDRLPDAALSADPASAGEQSAR